jgi:hypothetical protein
MTVSRLLSACFVLLVLVASGCGGSTEVTEQPAANFAGEYSFVVTGAGGTCVEMPPATGTGVEIVSQKDNWATGCFVKDLCDGEICRAGAVTGNVFTSNVQSTRTTGACEVRESRYMVTTLNADGDLDRRLEQSFEYVGGDCSGLVLPCAVWQTSVAAPCDDACYEGYCPGGM